MLSDPQKREMYDLGGDPFSTGGGFGSGFGFSDIMDAFFGAGGGGGRGPRPRQRRGQDALIRLELDLAEATFGATRDLQVDTAVVCPTCSGAGAAPGTSPRTCDVCHGRGEVQQVTRSFLGQVMTSRPCAACQGFGTVIPDPCHECGGDGRVRTRRTLTVKIPPGVDTGTRIQLAGEGEAGPGGGPAGDLYVEIVERPHAVFQRQGDDLHCTVSVPMTAAALGTDGDARDPRRPAPGRAAAGHPVRPDRHAARPRRHAPARRRAAATSSCTSTCRRRPGSTPSRRSCCASSRRCAARTAPTSGTVTGSRPELLLPAARRLQRALTGREVESPS